MYIAGSGLGLAFVPSIEALCAAFNKYRPIALSIGASGACVGTFVFPPLLRYFESVYAYRGALILTAGLAMQLIICGALVRPYKKILQNNNESDLNIKQKAWNNTTKLKSIMNMDILHNKGYLLLCLNNVLSTLGHTIVIVHLSAYSTSLGYHKTKGAMLFSAMGAAGWAGRLFYGVLIQKTPASSIGVYTIGFISCAASSIVCPFLEQYPLIMVYSIIYGFSYGVYGTLMPMILVNMLGADKVASGYGYALVCCAIGSVTGGPLAGKGNTIQEQYFYCFFLC